MYGPQVVATEMRRGWTKYRHQLTIHERLQGTIISDCPVVTMYTLLFQVRWTRTS